MFFIDHSSNSRFTEEQTASNLSLTEILQATAVFTDYRETQSKTSAIIKAFSSIISILASCAIIWMIRRSHLGLSTTYHRLILGLCISDLVFSSCFPLLNTFIPSELDYMVWNAKGNIASCNFQGMTITVGLTCGLYYHCSLNLFYIAVIKFEKSDEYIRSKIEPFLHAFPIILSIVLGIIRFVNKNYNDSGFGTCRATTYHPPHCKTFDDGIVPDGFNIPCGRGHTEQDTRRMITTFSICVIPLFSVAIFLAVIYAAVLKQEKKLSKYGIGPVRKHVNASSVEDISSLRSRCNLDSGKPLINAGGANNIDTSAALNSESTATNEKLQTNSLPARLKRCVERAMASMPGICERKSHKSKARSKSRTVMYKAIAYSLAYLASNLAFLIMFFLTIVKGKDNVNFSKSMVYFYNFTDPLSGFYNFIVFIYPAVVRFKDSKKNQLSWYQALVQAFWSKGAKRKNQGRTPAVRSRPTSRLATLLGEGKTSNIRHESRVSNPLNGVGKNRESFGVSKPAEEMYDFPENPTCGNLLQPKRHSNRDIVLSAAADGDTLDNDVDEDDRGEKSAEDIEDPVLSVSPGLLSEARSLPCEKQTPTNEQQTCNSIEKEVSDERSINYGANEAEDESAESKEVKRAEECFMRNSLL